MQIGTQLFPPDVMNKIIFHVPRQPYLIALIHAQPNKPADLPHINFILLTKTVLKNTHQVSLMRLQKPTKIFNKDLLGFWIALE